ncbi:MAG: hypothetical protein ACYTX0_33040 [Nostoc sp.]
MKIESILTIIAGMSNTLQIIKDHPQLKDLQASEFYSTPNDLTFGDITLAVEEVLDGLIRAKSQLENGEVK